MRTIFLTIIALFIYEQIFSQSEMYYQKMGEALGGFSTVESVDDYTALASNFERIAGVETEQWLPLYYHAQCYILMSFTDREADGEKKDNYLDIAEGSIDKMIELAPEESEVYALQSFLYTGRIVVDPMSRGMSFSQKSNAAIEKSLKFNPDNPRAKYLRLSNNIGTANFFGQETTQYCEQAEQLLQSWDQFQSESNIHPSWGKELVQGIIIDCQNTEEAPVEKAEVPPTESINEEAIPESSVEGHVLTLVIENLPNDNGVVMVELLNEKEEPVTGLVGEIKEGVSHLVVEGLSAGTYSVQYYHDENQNGKMDANKWGMPIEAYGFSNNVRGSFGPPDFEKTLFDIADDLTLSLKAK